MRNIISLTFAIFLLSCGGVNSSNSSEPIQQNDAQEDKQTNTQTNNQSNTQSNTQTETKEVIKANFGKVKFGEAKFE